MKLFKYIQLLLVLLSLFVSCNKIATKEKVPSEKQVSKDSNITKIRSTDIDTLGRILDFSNHQPIKVEFRYTLIDNSGKNDRLSVPGPSDSSLEAVLYFDKKTFKALEDFELNLEWIEQHHNKEIFNFEWLPQDVRQELEQDDRPNYKGHPDFFFGTGVNGKAWYLDQKIILTTYTN
ncbi:hypothetical protein [Psychroserpens sp. SPM9]|uniref:hypothetical protein n=1 Tax=Psychroserpens sp. SPM9 TaxID=2975598 RepID=UPI0021A54276|nr:hypothetical protein [Psychroserpens sp. SPM9]MDG5492877.1 hypothetical protein [Psychroserpens sp. SPM9]